MNYTSAGVDIEAGDRFARYIGSIRSPAVSAGIGGFAGAMELDLKDIPDPLLLSTTDGVGTKLLVAERLKRYNTLGIDLVAMCVNDLAVCGAQPLQFLDYIACGRIASAPLEEIMSGIVAGCEQANCTLAGGETAEMPDVYEPHAFDLAGFCTGVVSRARMLPKKNEMKPGDLILGIASSGVHSNGLSLARKAIASAENADTLFERLLEPTRIYVPELMHLAKHPALLGAAHVTGGGLEGNLVRVLPDHLQAQLNWNWSSPDIFREIERHGAISGAEMKAVFNMGVGIALVVDGPAAAEFGAYAEGFAGGLELLHLGTLADTQQS